jgi:hypothetical protein
MHGLHGAAPFPTDRLLFAAPFYADAAGRPHFLSDTLIESMMTHISARAQVVRPELMMPTINWKKDPAV